MTVRLNLEPHRRAVGVLAADFLIAAGTLSVKVCAWTFLACTVAAKTMYSLG